MTRIAIFLFIGLITAPPALSQETRKKSAPGAEVYFISPKDGEVVSSPVMVHFGLKGMGVAPSGIFKENTGHHHLLIDLAKLPNMNTPIPKDESHKHFGGGETEVTLTLSPGEHTLQLLLGDLAHIPHDPPIISKKIKITVK
jgi:hypothetical protein